MVRRLQFLALASFLVIAAFSTGADFLFFLLYLGILAVGGAYVLTRFGLSDLEAGYVLDRTQAQVGEALRATYTVRNTSRLPKPWLEVHNPTDLPIPIPGRALALGPRSDRSWIARVPLTRRGHFRIDPLVVRTGDPFGFFESYAAVGTAASVVVYPRIESLPRWRLPPASVEGTRASPERTLQTTPLVTSIRPYVPGDAYNRIHWKSSARQGELQVKEFDLEQTADLWLFLDLEAAHHAGDGDDSTLEVAVRIAASIAARALLENRAVALTTSGARRRILPPDRGSRQYQKVMQLLAAVDADGDAPLGEVLVESLTRLRRGMNAVIVTPSTERDWVRPLAALRPRGVGSVVCHLDGLAFAERARLDEGLPLLSRAERDEHDRAARALRHALAEHEIRSHRILPGRSLGEQLVAAGSARAAAVR